MNTIDRTSRSPAPAVDLTMMHAFHAALRRDLERLSRAARRADLADPDRATSIRGGWEVFGAQLHLHHTHEDRALWPRLRARLDGCLDAIDVLAAMEDEHARVGSAVKRVEAFLPEFSLSTDSGGDLPDAVDTLIDDLSAHLAHEERDALPLIGQVLTQQEWASFVAEQRRSTGLRGAAELFPWLLEATDDADRQRIMRALPPPLRIVYRGIWAPRYARRNLWGDGESRVKRHDRPASVSHR